MKGIAALRIGVVANVLGVIAVQKLEGAIVNGQTQQTHVVGVHDPMAKAHGLPMGQQIRCSINHGLQQGCIGIAMERVGVGQGHQLAGAHEIGQLFQSLGLVDRCEMLKMAKTQKTGRDAGHHGGCFQCFSNHAPLGARQSQSSGRGNAQTMHGLAAQKLPNAGAQHRPAIAHARVGGLPCAFELHPQGAERCVQLAQPQRTTIAQLAGPDTKLVTAVNTGQAGMVGPGPVARENVQQAISLLPVGGPAQIGREAVVHSHPMGLGQGCWGTRRPKGGPQLGKAVQPSQGQGNGSRCHPLIVGILESHGR